MYIVSEAPHYLPASRNTKQKMMLHSITLCFIYVSPERVCERIHVWVCNKHTELKVIRTWRNGLDSGAAESRMLIIRCIKMGYRDWDISFFLNVLAQNCIMLSLIWLIFTIVTITLSSLALKSVWIKVRNNPDLFYNCIFALVRDIQPESWWSNPKNKQA